MRYQPGMQIDRFEVLEPLGEGAYAETYKALDSTNGNTVVLKCLNPNLFADPQNFQRFRREAEIVSRLDHPNVLRSLDDHANRTEPYLVLEYVDGENLRRRLENRKKPVPIDLALDWGHQIASALVYLHSHGIVHRDLKPENVLVTTDGTLRLMDFGTALLDGAKRLTWRHLGESIGTPDYMSPEQVKGNRGDVRSDVYSWGVLMYEILTGVVPFSGDNWMATMAAHLQNDPKPMQKLRPDVPDALDAVIRKSMRRYPESRYQTVSDLLDDLDHLDTLDVSSFDLGPEEPMGGMAAGSNPKRLWGFVALVVVSFVGIIGTILVVARVS